SAAHRGGLRAKRTIRGGKTRPLRLELVARVVLGFQAAVSVVCDAGFRVSSGAAGAGHVETRQVGGEGHRGENEKRRARGDTEKQILPEIIGDGHDTHPTWVSVSR